MANSRMMLTYNYEDLLTRLRLCTLMKIYQNVDMSRYNYIIFFRFIGCDTFKYTYEDLSEVVCLRTIMTICRL